MSHATALQGASILVTGGAGFVGSHLVDALVRHGARRVVALDNLVRGRREFLEEAVATGRCELVVGDVRERELVDRLVRGCDYVFHQAALRITACAEDPRAGHEVMLDGSFHVLEAAARHKVRKIIAASSASVYGEPERQPIAEDAPMMNRTLYGAAKIALEHYLRAFHDMYRLPYVALRYFNVYGPRMDMTGVYTEVMVRWMDRIDAGEPPLVFGKGDQSMDFVYVSDCVEANLLAVTRGDDEAVNVATGVETSLLELCDHLLRIMGRPDLRPEMREERKVNPVRHRRGDVTRAAQLLGFTASVPLEEGLRRLVAWRREWRPRLMGS